MGRRWCHLPGGRWWQLWPDTGAELKQEERRGRVLPHLWCEFYLDRGAFEDLVTPGGDAGVEGDRQKASQQMNVYVREPAEDIKQVKAVGVGGRGNFRQDGQGR